MGMQLGKMLLGVMLASGLHHAHATEDSDTPGAGKWEINLGIRGERNAERWTHVLPDMDLNLGIGNQGQLVLVLPSMVSQEDGEYTRSGIGTAAVGYKWRLLDQEQAGYAMALFPTYSWNVSSDSERRGLVEPIRSLVIPLILGLREGKNALFVQGGHNVVWGAPSEWLAGLKLTRQCLQTVECRVEIDHNRALHQPGNTLASIGFKWSMSDDVILQASLGRDIGARDDEQRLAFKFGLQLLR